MRKERTKRKSLKNTGLRKERLNIEYPLSFPDIQIKEYGDMTKEQPDQGIMLWRTRIK